MYRNLGMSIIIHSDMSSPPSPRETAAATTAAVVLKRLACNYSASLTLIVRVYTHILYYYMSKDVYTRSRDIILYPMYMFVIIYNII